MKKARRRPWKRPTVPIIRGLKRGPGAGMPPQLHTAGQQQAFEVPIGKGQMDYKNNKPRFEKLSVDSALPLLDIPEGHLSFPICEMEQR